MELNRKVICVIPNFNGSKYLKDSIESLLNQTYPCEVVLVDNGSTDKSVEIANKIKPKITVIQNHKNLGFSGGVNTGIKYGLQNGADFIALFNNDAIADKHWLSSLVEAFSSNEKIGITTGKLIKMDSQPPEFDSAGDCLSSWLLAFPRGRGEIDGGQFDKQEYVFSATGGASLYKTDLFKDIGLFDEDFFAYYEDMDLSFRAQLKGWKVFYTPNARAYHKVGATSSKIPGFTTYHSTKNILWIPLKNLPGLLFFKNYPKFLLVYWILILNQVRQGNIIHVSKGLIVALALTPKKIIQRLKIQNNKSVSAAYISSIFYEDLPPDRLKLKKLFNSRGRS